MAPIRSASVSSRSQRPRASGATFRGTIEEAERTIVQETIRYVAERSGASVTR